MSDLKTRFEVAAVQVRSLSQRPDNQTLLKLYALYKQATEGDVTGDKPGFADIVARFKYDAWHELQGKLGSDAMAEYIEFVADLID
jgi:diazepam-binding inhibitor (GABA receptor modulating acyl-CoA-binding protein)